MAAGKKLFVAHNVDVARTHDADTPGVKKGDLRSVRYKAGTIVSGSEFTKDELETLTRDGAVRPVTPDEEETADAQERAAEVAAAQAEHDQERTQLAREHASARTQVERKHDRAKADELAKLEESHAKEREALDKELAKKVAPPKASAGKR